MYNENDVIIITGSLTQIYDDTEVDVVVNEPGTSIPVSADIVEDGLYHSLQDHNATIIRNLSLAVVNVSVVSMSQIANSLSVRLENIVASEVRIVFIPTKFFILHVLLSGYRLGRNEFIELNVIHKD